MPALKKIKILVIDDDEDDYFIINDYINEIDSTKFTIDWCNNYQSAVEEFKSKTYDLYFVDYRLGNETGLELVKEAFRLQCDDPIILLTGKGNRAIDIEAMKSGATDYLIKSALTVESLERCIRYSLERAASLKTIKESEKRLKIFFRSGPDAIIVINERQQILEWNPKAEAIFGYTSGEAIGKLLSETIIPHQYREAHRKGMFHFLETGEGPVLNKTIEITGLHKKGHEFYINLSISNVKMGCEWIFIAFLSDITERKKTEEALIYKEAELLQARVLEQKKDEFISIASHELKTPLTMIKAYAQLALTSFNSADEMVFDYLIKIDQFTNKINDLISNLLDVSRIQAGKLKLTLSQIELSAFLEETLNSIRYIVPDYKIIIKQNAHAITNIDTLRMEQVISNIVSNAAKYSPGKNEILINSKIYDSEVMVSFTDLGIGIPEENLDKIFNRFYRVNEDTNQFSGLGIGLFISAEIIKQHGGRIWAESEFTKGSTFYFTLPISK